MSTLIEQVQAMLDPLTSGGAWYGINTTEPPKFPFIVWQRIVSVPNVSLSGPSDMQNTRVQIDIYARTVNEVASIETAIEALMSASAIVNVPLSSQDIYEDQVKAFRIIKEYSMWSVN